MSIDQRFQAEYLYRSTTYPREQDLSSKPECKDNSSSSTKASNTNSISSLPFTNYYTLATTPTLGYYPDTFAVPTTTIDSLEAIDPSTSYSLHEAQLVDEHSNDSGLIASGNDRPRIPLTDESRSLASVSLPRESDFSCGATPVKVWDFCTPPFGRTFDPVLTGPDDFGSAESWGLYGPSFTRIFDPVFGAPDVSGPIDFTLVGPVGEYQHSDNLFDEPFDTGELMGLSNASHSSMPMADVDTSTSITGAHNQVLSSSFSFPQQSDLDSVTASTDNAYQCTPQTPSSSSEHTRTPSKPHKGRQTSASLVSNANHKTQDFVNYTNDNIWRETKIVAPSGSFKTRQRREKKLNERHMRETKEIKARLSMAVRYSIGKATSAIADLEKARDEQSEALSTAVEYNIRKAADALAELKRNLEEQLVSTDNMIS